MINTASRSATFTGLAVALLGIPAITLLYNALVPAPVWVGPLLLREATIFALVAILLVIVTQWEGLSLRSIGLGTAKIGPTLLWAGIGFVALGIGTAAALGLLPLLGLTYGGGAKFVPPLWATALVVLRAGIAEEVFYRGFAIERLQALTGNRWLAALIPLVFFAAFHYRAGVAGILIAFLLGAILTGLYLWKRNLAANILAHFLIDFVPNVILPLLSAP